MAVIKTIFKGESLSMLFTFPEAYDMSRIEKQEIYIGSRAFTGTVSGQSILLKLKSDDTGAITGQHRISLWLDDSILGVRKPYVGDITIANTQATPHNTSTSNISDIIIPILISETAITVDNVLYNYVKGDPFLYSDFTPAQIAELQQPAADAIASIQAVELSVEQAEALRVQAEIDRQTNTGTAIQKADAKATLASDAAILANTKAGLADTAATNANTKAGLADTAATNANTKAGLADAAATNADNARLAIQGDLASKENTANKKNSLATDGTGTKFPTVDAVNAGLSGKANAEVLIASVVVNNPYFSKSQISIDLDTNTFTIVSHGFVDGDIVALFGLFRQYLIPTPLISGKKYYIISATENTFKLALTANGAEIDITSIPNNNYTLEKLTTASMVISGLDEQSVRVVILANTSENGMPRTPFILYNNVNAVNTGAYEVGITPIDNLGYESFLNYRIDAILKHINGVIEIDGHASVDAMNTNGQVVKLYSNFYGRDNYNELPQTNINRINFITYYQAPSQLIMNGTKMEIYRI